MVRENHHGGTGCSQIPNTVIARDIAANDEKSIDAETVASYLNALRKIFVVEDMPA